MRKFLVKVNGTDYEVEVEEILGAGQVSGQRPSGNVVATTLEQKAPAAPKPAAAEHPAAAAAPAAGSVCAPMPGTILSVSVHEGDRVKKGDVLAVLEAMKMENEIQAPSDGTVTAVHVSANSSVDTGSPIVTLA